MKLLKKQVIFLFLIILIPLISSAPPLTIIQQFQTGYAIIDTPQIVLKQNQDFTYNFFVYNLTNGDLIDNSSTNCIFYLANSSGKVIYISNASFVSGFDYWEVVINGNTFSQLGEYSYGTQCQSTSTDYGGTVIGTWRVTSSGEAIDLVYGFLPLILLLSALLFLGLAFNFSREYWMLKSFFNLIAIIFLIIGINAMYIIVKNNSYLGKMALSGLIITIIIFSLFIAYIFILNLIEIIKALRKKRGVRWKF